jgi:hypothetical protein
MRPTILGREGKPKAYPQIAQIKVHHSKEERGLSKLRDAALPVSGSKLFRLNL